MSLLNTTPVPSTDLERLTHIYQRKKELRQAHPEVEEALALEEEERLIWERLTYKPPVLVPIPYYPAPSPYQGFGNPWPTYPWITVTTTTGTTIEDKTV